VLTFPLEHRLWRRANPMRLGQPSVDAGDARGQFASKPHPERHLRPEPRHPKQLDDQLRRQRQPHGRHPNPSRRHNAHRAHGNSQLHNRGHQQPPKRHQPKHRQPKRPQHRRPTQRLYLRRPRQRHDREQQQQPRQPRYLNPTRLASTCSHLYRQLQPR
jgi:hypothetical protein